MAFDPKFKYYLIDPVTGEYYMATDYPDGTYTVELVVDETPLSELPDGWDKLEIQWMRNRDYFGNFRSASQDFKFAGKSWAILSSLFIAANAQAQCILRIDEWQPDFTYDTVYKCYLDFSRYVSNEYNQTATIGTIDSGLYSRWELNATNEFAVRYWDGEPGDWTTEAIACYDEGISLLFNARYTDGSTSTDPITYTIDTIAGDHTTPSLQNIQLVPYIGNVILADLLKIGSQSLQDRVSAWNNYTIENYVLKNLITGGVLFMKPILTLHSRITYRNPAPGNTFTLSIDISEVDRDNVLVSTYNFFEIVISNNPGLATGTVIFSDPIEINENSIDVIPSFFTITQLSFSFNLTYDRIYVVNYKGVDSTGAFLFELIMDCTKNEFFATSKHITGIADTDLRFPASSYLGFRPHTLLEKLVPLLNSNETDSGGFPIVPVGTPYVGRSDYLSDPTVTLADNYDNIPYNTLFTSDSAIRLMPGQQYMNMSLSKFFQICFSLWNLGMAIENDDSGEPNVVRVEPLTYFFDKDTELFDLGFNITAPEIMPLTEYICGEINAGYTAKWQDFSEYIGNNSQFFGVDAFNIFQSYRPPFTQGKKNVRDMVAPVVAEPSRKEAARSQLNAEDMVGGGPTSPIASNAGNDIYLMELEAAATEPVDIPEPGGVDVTFTAYLPLTYPTATGTDPTVSPYVRGLYFPQTAQNLGLTPAKNMLRNGKFLHSIMDGQESRNIAFQKQYWNLYNGNLNVAFGGIATNLNAGLVTEVADIAVSDLPDKLFKPILIRFTTKQPLNMYEIMNTNNRGYISAKMKKRLGYGEVDIMGFIWDVTQNLGNESATTFTLLMHPDMVL